MSPEPDAAERFANVTAAYHGLSAAVPVSEARAADSSGSKLYQAAPPTVDFVSSDDTVGQEARAWGAPRCHEGLAASRYLLPAPWSGLPIAAGPVLVRPAHGDAGVVDA